MIREGSLVQGMVYCQGQLEHNGIVWGTVYTDDLISQNRGVLYKNHLLQGKINPFKKILRLLGCIVAKPYHQKSYAMAVLKFKSASLLEALVSLLLIVLLFSLSMGLLHPLYFKSLNRKRFDVQNTANALIYFSRFSDSTQIEYWKTLDTTYSHISVQEKLSTIL